jgi:hypothetical protein
MELYPAEVDSLKKLIEEWYLHDERELEATFSGKTASETTTFLNVAQRLEAKGFRALPQEDRLNIITPDQVRFTITGMGNIENYCREESLDGIDFEAMIKDRAGVESNVDLKEYNVRVKARREIKLAATDPIVTQILGRWPEQRKAFRILRRWTFMDDAGGVRYDLSMVRSSAKDARGGFLWAKTFKERDITRSMASYELEVELLRPTETSQDPAEIAAAQAKHMKDLIRGVGEVLRGINKHSLLIRNSTALKVLEGYKDLVKTDRFRGVAPITMLVENMTKAVKPKTPNIRTGYNVTDKADGLRMMGYVDARGELFMIDMSLNIYRTGLVRGALAHSLVDGEFVTSDKEGNPLQQFLLFDCYIAPDKQDVTERPFCAAPTGTEAQKRDGSRYGALMNWVDRWNEGEGPQIVRTAGVTEKNKIQVTAKNFIFATGDNIFPACARTLDSAKIYHTDGLILTPNAMGLPQKPGVKFAEQLKWKPSSENTVDFLALFDKDPDTQLDMIYSGTKGGMAGGETVQYKTLHLYVGSDLDPAYEDPRGTVLFEQPLPGQRQPGKGRRREYKPVLFNPVELPDTMANTCYLKVEEEGLEEDVVRCENGDPIEDKSIVEMRYDPKQEPGWRWIPMRIRYDKTERFQRGELGRTLNKDESAEGVWNSIHEPVTAYMIRTGMEAPSAAELAELGGAVEKLASGEIAKVYYARKEEKKDLMIVKGLREFHRRYVKEKILLGRGLRGGGKTLADLACGQGGDLWTWVDFNASFVFGTDIAGNGIRDPQDGAYRRYMNAIVKYNGYDNVPRMIFTIGSSAKNLATGEAGATPEESNMMRSVLGRVAPDGPVPPFVQKFGAGRLARGADCVAIMFAIHYFFENEMSLAGFMRNVNDTLAVGGLFIGCCFDGQKVFDALRMTPKDGSRTGVAEDGSEVWRITKRYDAVDLTNTTDSLGLPIDVKFISIGTEQREFLVSFDLLKAEMAKIGCELLNEKELKELDLTHSTQMFEDTFAAAKKKGEKFDMIPVVKEYSFFNRWFIFKRRRGGMLEDEEAEAEAEDEAVQEELTGTSPSALGALGIPSLSGRVNGATPPAPAPAAAPVKKTLAEQAAEARAKALATAAAKKGATAVAGEGEGAGAPLRTIPAAASKKSYTLTQLFQFYTDASQADKLKLKDPDAARWLAPSAPFAIKDTDGTEYPSVEHYLAAKKYELASNKPELGKELFARTGTIHQEFLRQRATESAQGARALTAEREHDLLKAERKKVQDESAPATFKKYRATFDDTAWFTVKDKELEKALTYRWENDARLRRIVEAAKAKGLYLLYYTGVGSGSDLGGKRTDKGFIDGENKVGEILMRLAKY